MSHMSILLSEKANCQNSTTRGLPVLLAVCLGGFLFQVDLTGLSAIATDVSQSYGDSAISAAWLMDAYSLALIFALPAAGSIADRFGRHRVFNVGTAIFAITSGCCALAPNFLTLLAFRVGQGFAGALLTSSGAALLAMSYEGTERRKAFAFMGTVIGAAMVVGPPLGSLLAQTVGWQWLFLLNVPLCALVVWSAAQGERQQPIAISARPMDWAGCATFAAATGLLCFVFIEMKWLQTRPLLMVTIPVVALACLVAFVAIERRQDSPALDLQLLRSRPFLGACLTPIAVSISYWSLLVLVPQFARGPLGLSVTESGYLLMCLTFPMLAFPLIGARLIARLGPGRFFAGGLGLIGTADLALAYVAANGFGVWAAVAALLIGGAGAALINAQISATAVSVAPSDRSAVASAISVVMRQFGFSFGVALLTFLIDFASFSAAFAAAGAIGICGAAINAYLFRRLSRPQ